MKLKVRSKKIYDLYIVLSLLFTVCFISGCAPLFYDTPNIYVGNIEASMNWKISIHRYRYINSDGDMRVEEIMQVAYPQNFEVLNSYLTDYEENFTYCFGIKEKYVVFTSIFDNDSNEYDYNCMEYHKKDAFAYLNDKTGCVDILYESESYEKIFYGTHEYVILYDWQKNQYRYVNIETGETYKMQDSHIKNNRSYSIVYNEDGNIVCKLNCIIAEKIVDTIEID